MSTRPATAGPVPHSALEDVLGALTGTFVISLGLFLLRSVDAVTGGAPGLALLLTYAVGLPFGVVLVAVNVPFFVLALGTRGVGFTARSVACVLVVSAFSELHPQAVDLGHVAAPYAVVTGNLLVGIGLLIVFRHGASLGGFSVVALLLQDRLGWRAGYVQMFFDVVVVLTALTVVDPGMVLLSAGGAVVLNLVLALNHRPGRYLGT